MGRSGSGFVGSWSRFIRGGGGKRKKKEKEKEKKKRIGERDEGWEILAGGREEGKKGG